jgi:hypothetical protein
MLRIAMRLVDAYIDSVSEHHPENLERNSQVQGQPDTCYSVVTWVASFALPYIGRQIDRREPRVMVGVIRVLLALACAYMSFVLCSVSPTAGLYGVTDPYLAKSEFPSWMIPIPGA